MVKFREVSGDVWVCWKGIVTEKTLKEEWKNKNDFYDNYNSIIVWHNDLEISPNLENIFITYYNI